MILGAAVLMTACAGEEEDLFDKSAAERLNEMSSVYAKRLEAQPAGWAMQYYYAPNEAGYLLLADFSADHSVSLAMNNEFTSNKYMEERSVWDVITDNGPVLTFNTYNELLHLFSDPSGDFGGDVGTGLGGDYEFIIVDAPEDGSYIMLKGKKRGAYTLLTPLEEGTDFETYLDDVINFRNTFFSRSAPNSIYLKKNGEVSQSYTISYNTSNENEMMITPEGKDMVTYGVVNGYLVTKRGGNYYVRFRDDVNLGDGETSREFMYDEANDQFVDVANENVVICSSNVAEYLAASMAEPHTWTVKKDQENSEKFFDIISKASSAMTAANRRHRINSVTLAQTEPGVCQLSFNYGDSKQWARYNFNYQISGDQLSMQFISSDTDGSETIRNKAGVTELVDAFNGTFTISIYQTAFNMSKMKITSTSDSSLWMVLNY